MNELKLMIWFFPIIFIFHDFEEIILMQSWMRKNLQYLRERFPWISQRLLKHFENITTSSFALGVAEEFVLIIIITMISFIANRYILWTGMFVAFSFVSALLSSINNKKVCSCCCYKRCLYASLYLYHT